MIFKNYAKTLISAFLITFASIGFGRLSFGIILPDMQESLNINTTQIGLISTINFLGYFIGILSANYIYSKYTTHQLIFVSLILLCVLMFSMTLTNSYILISIFYIMSGFCTAIAYMSIMSYIASIIPQYIRGKALGIVVGGSGLAIILSGIIVPKVDVFILENSWKISWAIFSIIILIVAFISLPGIKQHNSKVVIKLSSKNLDYFKKTVFWKIAYLYITYGFTYIVYMTFFVSAVTQKYEVVSSISGKFWILLGFCSIFSGFLFGYIADKFGSYKSIAIVFILQTIANILLSINSNLNYIWLSVTLIGISLWAIPSLVALLSSIYFDTKKTAQVLSLFTILFAIAQTVGPFIGGIIRDASGDFSLVFYINSFLTFIAIIFSLIFSKSEK